MFPHCLQTLPDLLSSATPLFQQKHSPCLVAQAVSPGTGASQNQLLSDKLGQTVAPSALFLSWVKALRYS